MTLRQQQIEQVACLISRQICGGYEFGTGLSGLSPEQCAERDAAIINAGDGWTFDLSGSLDHWIRHEGIRLAPTELAEAVRIARRLAEDDLA